MEKPGAGLSCFLSRMLERSKPYWNDRFRGGILGKQFLRLLWAKRSHEDSDFIMNLLHRISSKKHILESLFSLSALRGIEQILPLITFPYVIAKIGAEKYGILVAAQFFVFIFCSLVDFGLNVSAVKEAALRRSDQRGLNKAAGSVLFIRTCMFFLSIICCLLLLHFTTLFASRERIVGLSFLMTISQVFLPVWFFQGIEKMRFITMMSILSSMTYVILLFLFVKTEADYWRIPILRFGQAMVGVVVGHAIMFRRYKIRPVFDFNDVVSQIRACVPVFINGLCSVALIRVPVLVVSGQCGFETAGLFAVAARIVSAGRLVFITIHQAFFPRFSMMYRQNTRGYYRAWKRLFLFTVLLGIIMWFMLEFCAQYVFPIFDIDALDGAVLYLNIYSISFVTAPFIFAFGGLSLLVCGHARQLAHTQVLSVVIFLVMALPVLSRHGIIAFIVLLILVDLLTIVARGICLQRVGFFRDMRQCAEQV